MDNRVCPKSGRCCNSQHREQLKRARSIASSVAAWLQQRLFSRPTEQVGYGPSPIVGVPLLLGAALLHPATLVLVAAVYGFSRVAVKFLANYKDIIRARSIARIRRAAIKKEITVENAVELIDADVPQLSIGQDDHLV